MVFSSNFFHHVLAWSSFHWNQKHILNEIFSEWNPGLNWVTNRSVFPALGPASINQMQVFEVVYINVDTVLPISCSIDSKDNTYWSKIVGKKCISTWWINCKQYKCSFGLAVCKCRNPGLNSIEAVCCTVGFPSHKWNVCRIVDLKRDLRLDSLFFFTYRDWSADSNDFPIE